MNDCNEGCKTGLAVSGGFVLGFVLATLFLVYFPKFHRFAWGVINCRICFKPQIKDIGAVGNGAYSRSHFYADIEEQFMESENAAQQQMVNGKHMQMSIKKKGYEPCDNSSRGLHKYTSIGLESRIDYKPQTYEPVEVYSSNQDEIYAPNHVYSILDPGSNKRLPVRVLPREDVKPDPGHVYFVLRPGTNQVTPLYQSQSTLRRNGDQIYFVLEPSNEQFDDTNAYAVSDLSPEYYILEPFNQ